MGRYGENDSQAYARIVAVLLAFAALAVAAAALPAPRRMVLLAVLRHAADVACAFAGKVHAPVDRRLWPTPGEDEAAQLAKIFGVLAHALAVPAREAMRAAGWLIHRAFKALRDCPPVSCGCITPRPPFADTS